MSGRASLLARIAGLALLAACAPALASAADAGARSSETLSVVFGPSLARLIEIRLAPEFTRATGVPVAPELEPSLAGLRLVTREGTPTDVVVLTDPEALARKTTSAQAPYYVVFAANAIVVGYRTDSPYGRAVAAGKPWFEALRAGGVRFGRLDPALDPLGYRAIFVLQLARAYYDTGDLVGQILRPDQIVAASDFMPKLQRGELDVALLYRSQAVEAGLALLELPIEINLADPGRRGVYDEASLEVGGNLERGEPLVLIAAPLAGAPHAAAALRFVDFLGTPLARRILDADGYVVLPGFPLRRPWGQAP
jgi:molybdate/tungstate transport system substrate-binding protein